jgi:hypothetical protein
MSAKLKNYRKAIEACKRAEFKVYVYVKGLSYLILGIPTIDHIIKADLCHAFFPVG